MNNEHPTIEDRLNRVSPTKLSPEERERLWSSIHMRIANTPMLTPSPFSIQVLITHNSYTMVSAFIALLLLIGGGATVAASDSARPGDTLFAVDRAVENVRLALASDDSEGELRVRFANERVNEFENIIEEGKGKRLARVSDDASVGTEQQATMALKVVSDDTSNDDDSSDDSDDADDSFDEDSKEHIAEGLSETLRFFAEASVQSDEEGRGELDQVLARLNGVINELPEDLRAELRIDENNRVRVEANGDDEGKIEVRSEGVRTKVEFKDGVVSVETKADDDSSDDSDDDINDDNGGDRPDDDSDDDDSDDDSSSNTSGMEIEADVFLDTTIVKVEINDRKELFVTNKKTRAEIVSAIAAKFNLDSTLVDSALSLEIENRLSRPTDSLLGGGDDDSSDDSDDDSSDDNDGEDDSDDDDEDEDEDDDNGGHGGDDEDDD